MPFLAIPAGRLHYELDGPNTAPVLVLSASLGAPLAMWAPQIAPLSRRFRVLRYDARGHGLSAVPPGPYTINDLGGDVVALLDALAIRRAHFCGISMGGLTALWLGLHAAGRIERLVVCNTAARFGTAEVWNDRMATVRQEGIPAIADRLMQRWFTADFRATHPATVEAIRQMVLRTPVEGYVACCAAVRDTDFRSRAGEIKLSALILAGASDAVAPPAEARFLAEQISGARLLELPAAHLSNIEAAEQFTAAVLDFLP
jgi:3-oxoadipate enol-lactonase